MTSTGVTTEGAMAMAPPGGSGDDLQRSISEQYSLIKAERENDVEQWHLKEVLKLCKLPPDEKRTEVREALLREYRARKKRVEEDNKVTDSQQREHMMTLSQMGGMKKETSPPNARITASMRLGTQP